MDINLTPDGLKALAAEIAEHIVRDESLASSLILKLAARLECSPGELCCDELYICTQPFSCRPIFGCTNGFWGIARKIQP